MVQDGAPNGPCNDLTSSNSWIYFTFVPFYMMSVFRGFKKWLQALLIEGTLQIFPTNIGIQRYIDLEIFLIT